MPLLPTDIYYTILLIIVRNCETIIPVLFTLLAYIDRMLIISIISIIEIIGIVKQLAYYKGNSIKTYAIGSLSICNYNVL